MVPVIRPVPLMAACFRLALMVHSFYSGGAERSHKSRKAATTATEKQQGRKAKQRQSDRRQKQSKSQKRKAKESKSQNRKAQGRQN